MKPVTSPETHQFGLARNPWTSPAFVRPRPTISPRELMTSAINKYNGELAGISELRSVITPFCQTKARRFPVAPSTEKPTAWPLSLIDPQHGVTVKTAPGNEPMSFIPDFLVHRKLCTVPSDSTDVPTTCPRLLMLPA